MYYIDTHAHIYKEYYEDIENVINNAKEQNVQKIISCAVDLSTTKEVINLQNKHKNIIYSAVGIHPEYASTYTKKDLEEIKKIIKDNKIYAIGEIGLDYYYDSTNKKEQITLFKYFLDIASEKDLSIIIHSREANEDVIKILKQYKLKGVIHSFSGTKEELEEFLNLGFLIGINGISTFKNADKEREILKHIPLENILLETDSPYLTPHPFRKYQNEPKFIPEIGKKVSKILEKPEKKVMEKTTQNATNIFDLD